MSFRPGKWLIGLIPLAGVTGAAIVFDGNDLETKLANESRTALSNAQMTWAKVDVHGRDVALSGDSPSRQQLDSARRIISELEGVRRVDTANTRVVLGRPTVEKLESADRNVTLIGTWPQEAASKLTVEVGGKAYVLGTDNQLTSDESTGNWRLAVPQPLNDGIHDVKVTVSDNGGASASDETSDEVLIDSTPPEKATVSTIGDREGMVTMEGNWPSEDARTLKLEVGSKAYELGKSPQLTASGNKWRFESDSRFADGEHDVAVVVADRFGNATRTESPKPLIIDTSPMAAPAVSNIVSEGDQHAIAGTFDRKKTKKLRVSVGERSFELGRDAELQAVSPTNWLLTFSGKLPEGTNPVTVEAVDHQGAGLTAQAQQPIVVVKAEPEKPDTPDDSANTRSADTAAAGDDAANKETEEPQGGDDSTDLGIELPVKPGASDTPAAPAVTLTPPTVNPLLSNEKIPLVTGTWEEKANHKLTVSLGGSFYAIGDGYLISDGDGNWRLRPNGALAEGKHDVTVIVTDADRNSATDTSVDEITLDLSPPGKPTVVRQLSAASSPVITGDWASGDSVRVEVSVGGRVYTSGEGGLIQTGGGKWTLPVPEKLSDGTYEVRAVAFDAAGNSAGDASSSELVIDTTPPVDPTVNTIRTNRKKAEISGTWDGSGNDVLEVSVAGRTYRTGQDRALQAGGSQWILSLADALPEGRHEVAAKATDAAGNSAQDTSSNELEIDTTPPVTPTVESFVSRDGMAQISGGWKAGKDETLSVKVGNKTYRSETVGEVTFTGDSWTVKPLTRLADGQYDVVATARDSAGNVARDGTVNEILIDSTSPSAPTVRPYSGEDRQPVISGSWPARDAVSLVVRLDGRDYRNGKDKELVVTDNGGWSLRPAGELEPGLYDVTATAIDAAGNSSSDTSSNEVRIKKAKVTERSTPEITVEVTEGKQADPAANVQEKSSDGAEGEATVKVSGGNTETEKADVAETAKPDDSTKAQGNVPASGNEAEKAETNIARADATETADKPKIDCQQMFSALLGGETIHFEFNQALIAPESRKLLNELANAASLCPDASIEIAGHTDWVGSSVFNKSLSERRALAVVETLVGGGVDRSRLKAAGYGEARPITSNATREGRALNRRIEFVVK